MREYLRWSDQFPTATLTLSKPSTSGDETWVGFIPFNTVFLDHRPEQKCLLGFILDVAVGTADGLPDGVQVQALANTSLADFDSDFDPRLAPRTGITLQVTIPAGTTALDHIPVVIYGIPVASDAPSTDDITLPDPVTNSTAWTVRNLQGGTVPTFWEEVSSGGGGGTDAPQVTVLTLTGDHTADTTDVSSRMIVLRGTPGTGHTLTLPNFDFVVQIANEMEVDIDVTRTGGGTTVNLPANSVGLFYHAA